MLIGEVRCDFTAGPSERKRTAKTADAGTSTAPVTPLRIAQYSQVYMPAWTGSFAGCNRPCEAVGGNGNVSAAASADVVVINMMRPDAPWTRPPGQIWVGTCDTCVYCLSLLPTPSRIPVSFFIAPRLGQDAGVGSGSS